MPAFLHAQPDLPMDHSAYLQDNRIERGLLRCPVLYRAFRLSYGVLLQRAWNCHNLMKLGFFWLQRARGLTYILAESRKPQRHGQKDRKN